MNKYSYRCFTCNSTFIKDTIDESNFYLCPDCGTQEKNQPLNGVLTIEYDYTKISDSISKQKFLSNETGKFWKFPYLWPINFEQIDSKVLEKLTLLKNNLISCNLKGKEFLILDESRNPTLSYKDRATSLIALKALELGFQEIAAASTGNAGSSLAGICSRLGLKSHVFVPKNIPEQKRIQIEAYGSDLVIVDGDYDKAFDICLEESKQNRWYNRNTAYNPLTIEGKKSAAYDIFLQLEGQLPDIVIIPVGDGVIISGIYKGFYELKQLGWIDEIPKLVGVQSEKSDALVKYVITGKFNFEPATTIADSISAGAPRNLYMAASAIKESNGVALAVSDEDILQSQREFIRETGILCEPSSAATYAAYKMLLNDDKITNNSVLLLITGNGLKDIESLK